MGNTKFIVIQLFNTLVTLSLLGYFPVVYLNLVYTHDTLPIANVPYYDPALTSAKSDRYQYEWFFYAMDIFRIIPPIMINFQITSTVIHGSSSTLGYILIVGFICILDLINLVKRSSDYGLCSTIQFCRNFNPANYATPNWVFLVGFWFNLAFLLFDAIYIYMAVYINDIKVQMRKEERLIEKSEKQQ